MDSHLDQMAGGVDRSQIGVVRGRETATVVAGEAATLSLQSDPEEHHGERPRTALRVALLRGAEHGPFKLNGEKLFLRGTHRHEDHAGLAAAMTEDLIRKEMQMIKEMGVNFMRLAHYPAIADRAGTAATNWAS